MGLFSVVYQIGSMSDVSDEEATTFMGQFKELVEDMDAIGIFVHNTTLSLPMFIPGFGVAWGLFSGWSTGFAFSAIVSITPQLSGIPPLAILYASPFGLMELVAYSVATSRSFILIKAISKKTNLIPFIKPTAIEIGIVVVLLFVGGFIEHYMIELASEQGLAIPKV